MFLFKKAKKIANLSMGKDNHKIGAILISIDGKEYTGFNIQKSSVLRSTCAEMMALDNWYQDPDRKPLKNLTLVGFLNRPNWKEEFICLPCGVCREMYHQAILDKEERKNFYFDCYSWNLKKNYKKSLKDLLFYAEPFYEEN